MTDFKRWTVAIVGGSLAGLAAVTELSRVTNADITVFEQTVGRLEGRGAGIVMQPEIERLLSISGISARHGQRSPARTSITAPQ
jgi:2-polyprenyl-6-methoxyphenol hydroxylase-like FAD-dependent oxidoreductase